MCSDRHAQILSVDRHGELVGPEGLTSASRTSRAIDVGGSRRARPSSSGDCPWRTGQPTVDTAATEDAHRPCRGGRLAMHEAGLGGYEPTPAFRLRNASQRRSPLAGQWLVRRRPWPPPTGKKDRGDSSTYLVRPSTPTTSRTTYQTRAPRKKPPTAPRLEGSTFLKVATQRL